MSLTFLIYATVIVYLGLTIYRANQYPRTGHDEPFMKALLYISIALMMLLGLFAVFVGIADSEAVRLAELGEPVEPLNIGAAAVVASLILSSLSAVVAGIIIAAPDSRQLLQKWLAGQSTYDARSVVHTTAIVLSLLLVTGQIVLFLMGGGTTGMAESIEADGVDASLPVFQAVLQVAAAFLGVGYALRRNMYNTLQRLGLRMPTAADINWGIGYGLMLFGLAIAYSIITSMFLAQDQIEEQTRAADSLAQAFATLPLALILSSSAAIGEEIFYRGALQPVFGNVVTSIIFALMHTQVLLSSGVVLIFVVSYVLGILRSRQSTTAAIIAHFVYNFVQLLLLILASSTGML